MDSNDLFSKLQSLKDKYAGKVNAELEDIQRKVPGLFRGNRRFGVGSRFAFFGSDQMRVVRGNSRVCQNRDLGLNHQSFPKYHVHRMSSLGVYRPKGILAQGQGKGRT